MDRIDPDKAGMPNLPAGASDKERKAYAAGWRAYEAGKSDMQMPDMQPNERHCWRLGYYSRRDRKAAA